MPPLRAWPLAKARCEGGGVMMRTRRVKPSPHRKARLPSILGLWETQEPSASLAAGSIQLAPGCRGPKRWEVLGVRESGDKVLPWRGVKKERRNAWRLDKGGGEAHCATRPKVAGERRRSFQRGHAWDSRSAVSSQAQLLGRKEAEHVL